MKSLLLTLAFLLEIVAFIAFAAFGYVFPLSGGLQIVLFVILFVALITFWSLYMAPKAPKKFSPLPYYITKALIYAVSAVTIFAVKGSALGIKFVILVLVDEALLFRHNLSQG